MSGGASSLTTAQAPSSLQPHFVHGIQAEVPNAIHYIDETPTWLYLAGTQVVYHSPTAAVQRFATASLLPGYKATLTALQLSADRKYVAVGEYFEHPTAKSDQKTQISIFEAETGKRKRTILYGDTLLSTGPAASSSESSGNTRPREGSFNALLTTPKGEALDLGTSSTSSSGAAGAGHVDGAKGSSGASAAAAAVTNKVSPITHIAFSSDSKQLACLTAASELSYWLWQKSKMLAAQTLKGSWTGQLSIDPTIGTQVAVSGYDGLWVGRYAEGKINGNNVWEADDEGGRPTALVGHVWVKESQLVAATATTFSLLKLETKGNTLTAEREVMIQAYIPPSMVQHNTAEKPIRTTCLCSTADGFISGTSMGGVIKYDVQTAFQPSFEPMPSAATSITTEETVAAEEAEASSSAEKKTEQHLVPISASIQVRETLQLADEVMLAVRSVASAPSTATGKPPRIVFVTEDKQIWSDVQTQNTATSIVAAPHTAAIASCCLCLRRPLLATLSTADHTLKLWNYQTQALELSKTFVGDDVSMVTMHPSGLYVLVGSVDKLRLYALLVEELRLVREFNIRGCKEIKFANGGQCFAVACSTLIYIIPTFPAPSSSSLTSAALRDPKLSSTKTLPRAGNNNIKGVALSNPLTSSGTHSVASTSSANGIGGLLDGSGDVAAAVAAANAVNQMASAPSECTIVLKGHNGRIRSLVFTKDDSRLISAGTDGAIYTWHLANGRREAEHILKGCGYAAAVPALRPTIVKATDQGDIIEKGALSVYAVGTDALIKEIVDGQVTKEVECNVALSSLAINNASTQLVVGTMTGSLRLFRLDAGNKMDTFEEIQCHAGAVAKVAFSNDDRAIFSVGEDGSVQETQVTERHISALAGREIQTHFSDELLMTKTDLQERTAAMSDLRARLEELKLEHEYQLRLRDMTFTEKSKDLKERFLIEIETLKIMFGSFKDDLAREDVSQVDTVQKASDRSTLEQHEEEQRNNEMMMTEYEKYERLQQETQRIQKSWETQSKSVEAAKNSALDGITTEYESKLRKYQHELSKTSDDARQKRRENAEHAQQHDEDIDTELQKLQHGFERQLREEREMAMRYKGENGVMRKKFGSLEKDVEENEAEKKRIESEHRKLQDVMKQLEKQIADLKKAVQDRDKAILDKEHKVYELKKNNQELEKFKFVLDYRIKELKMQIEPRETQIAGMTGEIRLMDTEIDRAKVHQQQLRTQMATFQKQLDDAKVASMTHREHAHKNENHMHEARFDLTEAIQFIQEPQVLMRHTERLKKKYAAAKASELPTSEPVTTEASSSASSSSTAVKSSEAPTRVTEQTQDVQRLNTEINALRQKLAENQALFRQDNLNTLRENQSMIKEINQLRKEIRGSQRTTSVSPARIISIKKVSELEAERGRHLPKLQEYQTTTSAPMGTRTPRLPAIQDSPMSIKSYHTPRTTDDPLLQAVHSSSTGTSPSRARPSPIANR